MSSQTESSVTSANASGTAPKPQRARKVWQIIAAVLGEPVMRSVEPKAASDPRAEDEEKMGPPDLSDLYPSGSETSRN